MTTAEFQVTGMTCSHCEHAVATEVGQLSGVQSVDVSAATGRLVVTATDPVEDCTANRPAPYSPIVRVTPGLEVQPTNQQLNDVIRYLLDLP